MRRFAEGLCAAGAPCGCHGTGGWSHSPPGTFTAGCHPRRMSAQAGWLRLRWGAGGTRGGSKRRCGRRGTPAACGLRCAAAADSASRVRDPAEGAPCSARSLRASGAPPGSFQQPAAVVHHGRALLLGKAVEDVVLRPRRRALLCSRTAGGGVVPASGARLAVVQQYSDALPLRVHPGPTAEAPATPRRGGSWAGASDKDFQRPACIYEAIRE